MPDNKSVFVFGLFSLVAVGLLIYIAIGSSFFAHMANVRPLQRSSSSGSIPDTPPKVVQIGTVQDRRLTEISGIDRSNKYPGSYWVHNDSGNEPAVFLITEQGQTRARIKLQGAKNIDWEDICVFEFNNQSYVCVADVGDNLARRKNYQLYVFEEPTLRLDDEASENGQELEIEDFLVLEFTYADGPKNCEAIAYNRLLRSFLLFQKAVDRGSQDETFGVYQLQLRKPLGLRSDQAFRIAEVSDSKVTGAAISKDCKQLIFCNYINGSYMRRRPAMNWKTQLKIGEYRRLALPLQRQGEAICFSADGKFAILVSEFGKQPIWKVDLQSQLQSDNFNSETTQ